MILAIAGLIAGLVSGFFTFLLNIFNPIAAIFSLILIIVLTPIFSVIFGFIWQGILYLLAKVFGGKGTYAQQFYLAALPISIVMILNGAVSWIPIAGTLLGFLIGIYGLYVQYVVIKELHGLSTGKALAVVLIPVFVVVAIVVVISILAAVLLASLLLGAAGGAARGY